MTKCKYCGQDAGWFMQSHTECEEKEAQKTRELTEVEKEMFSMCENTIMSNENYENYDKVLEALDNRISNLASENNISPNAKREILIRAFENFVNKAIEEKGFITEKEEGKLASFAFNQFNLTSEEMNRNKAFNRGAMGNIIRELLEGKIPTKVTVDNLPVNLLPTESFVYWFSANYYEDKTRTTYEGQSHGFSMKIVNGFWCRIGSYKGQPIQTTQRTLIDQGLFIITTKHLYFNGNNKTFRIPYSKIIALYPYDNGIGICQDKTNAKLQIFEGVEAWFVHNVVKILTNKNLDTSASDKKRNSHKPFAMSGKVILNKGDLDKALFNKKSDSFQTHSQLGQTAFDNGDLDKAFYEYSQAIKIRPDVAQPYYMLSSICTLKGEVEEGLPYCEKAIEINPDYAEAYFNRARIFIYIRNLEKALLDCNKAINLKPNFAEAYLHRGGIFVDNKDLEKALSDYNKAIEIRPDYAEAYFNRAIISTVREQYDKSWEDVHKAEELGLEVNVNFIKDLQEKSGREE